MAKKSTKSAAKSTKAPARNEKVERNAKGVDTARLAASIVGKGKGAPVGKPDKAARAALAETKAEKGVDKPKKFEKPATMKALRIAAESGLSDAINMVLAANRIAFGTKLPESKWKAAYKALLATAKSGDTGKAKVSAALGDAYRSVTGQSMAPQQKLREAAEKAEKAQTGVDKASVVKKAVEEKTWKHPWLREIATDQIALPVERLWGQRVMLVSVFFGDEENPSKTELRLAEQIGKTGVVKENRKLVNSVDVEFKGGKVLNCLPEEVAIVDKDGNLVWRNEKNNPANAGKVTPAPAPKPAPTPTPAKPEPKAGKGGGQPQQIVEPLGKAGKVGTETGRFAIKFRDGKNVLWRYVAAPSEKLAVQYLTMAHPKASKVLRMKEVKGLPHLMNVVKKYGKPGEQLVLDAAGKSLKGVDKL